MPRDVDGDDDQAVEAFIARQEKALESKRCAAALTAALSLPAGTTPRAAAVDSVICALEAVERGEGPRHITSAGLFIADSAGVATGARGAIILFLFHGTDFTDSADARLLARACSDGDPEYSTSSSKDLTALRSQFTTPAAAMPSLVNVSACTKLLPVDERSRLARVWASWLSESSWSLFELSALHRPSLGSWSGMGWEVECFATKNVFSGKPYAPSVRTVLQMGESMMISLMSKIDVVELFVREEIDKGVGAGAGAGAAIATPFKLPLTAELRTTINAAIDAAIATDAARPPPSGKGSRGGAAKRGRKA